MKKSNLITSTLIIALMIFSVGCTENNDEPIKDSILPSSFNIEVPSSLANSNSSSLKSTSDTINGNDVYAMMRAFIAVGNGSGIIVRDLMSMISYYNINKPMDVNYLSTDDKRLKRLVVTANESFNDEIYEYKMVISDVSDPIPADGLEMYWNRAPIKGVSIFSFYNLDRTETANKSARFRIDYSEASLIYDKTMEVSIVGIDTAGIDDNVNNLKMFVGKKGNLLDVYGNANLPKAKIIDQKHTDGYNWAFVARSNEDSNISVAKVALPKCTLNDVNNIFTTSSIKTVLTDEIDVAYPGLDPLKVSNFLRNTDNPAYFNGVLGFISCGNTAPVGFSPSFIDLANLAPYKPYDINALAIKFSN